MMKRGNPPYYSYMKTFRDFRELVSAVRDWYPDETVYSFRVRPSDTEIVRVTYRELYNDVRALGEIILGKGLAHRQVALVGRLSYRWMVVYLATLSVGAVIVPLDPEWSGNELTETLANAESQWIFADSTVIAKLGEREDTVPLDGDAFPALLASAPANGTMFDTAETDPDALAEIVYTSGTTGKGKGVMLSARALLWDLHGAFSILKVGKKTVAVLPPHHTYGSTINMLSALINGTEAYLSSGLRYIGRELEEQKPEYLILVPLYVETFYRKIRAGVEKSGETATLARLIRFSRILRKCGIDLRHRLFADKVLAPLGGRIDRIVCGGAPLGQEIIDAFDDLGVKILNGYGITECAPLISANRLDFGGKGSVGALIPGEEIRIDSPNASGEGEICVRGANVMMGYYRNEEATAAAFDEDGFFHTGDIGKFENDLLYVTGRVKNLIILSNGKNVYPEEIENSLATVPGVLEVIVYEGKSRRGREFDAITAEIFPDAAYLKEKEITDANAYFGEFVAAYNRTAVSYKKIGHLRVRTEEFPKSTMRKIQRFRIDCTID